MDTGAGAYQAVVSLKNGLRFIKFDGKNVTISRSIFGSGCKMDDQTSVAFFEDGNKCISGSPKGIFTIWMGSNAQK